ncbi:MAG: YbgC/FadM family acyl-CoA thioesterase [Alphaproteobacteria bacterium]|nr:YbgC/FadM family acyl-CoA thioesterase [Alphaproteobacteria bacterium]
MTLRPSSRADFSFFEPIRVRWADIDMQGIVFNPNYLVYADTAMTEYMRAVGFPYPDALLPFGADIFAVNSSVDFRVSARFDDLLDVGARIERIGRTSFRFRISVFRGDGMLADMHNTYVCATPGETRRPLAVPAAFIERVEAFETLKPERA